nr:hypothetical protein [Tanacetum cinerariifolium]
MDANKKIDLEHSLCPNESKILANILQNHSLRFNISASSSVPWIYLGQFWHTLKEDRSKYRLKFVLDRKELTLTLDDIRTTLCKMFSRCLTTRVTGYDQPPLHIMQMLYCFVNNIHVDYANLLWEGFHYSLEHPTTLIPYPRFTKLVVSHYMTAFPKNSRRARDKYHSLEDDEMVKSIFNLGKHKDEGTHRKTSAPRTPNPDLAEGKSSSSQKSTVVRLCIPQRCSTPLTPPTPIPTTDEADDIILQDTILLCILQQKSHEELKAKQSEDKVKEHLMSEEIEKLVEGTENVKENVKVRARSNKESLKVEITATEQPVNVIEEDEESAEVLTVNDPPPSSFTPSSSSPKPKLSAS